MRRHIASSSGFNHRAVMEVVRAGHSAQLIADLQRATGLALDSRHGRFEGILEADVLDVRNEQGVVVKQAFGGLNQVAFDAAQPSLVTTPNGGIPYYLANMLDPRLIQVIVEPMKAAQIAGEMKKGDWVTLTTQFIMIESTGQVSAYGDFSNGGNGDFNTNYPTRQSFHYQAYAQWGERELAFNELAGVDSASQKNVAVQMVLNKFQNKSYFFGVSGLKCYGLLNSPNLLASILPTYDWSTATADQCYQNILDLYTQIVRQGEGNIERDDAFTLGCSPAREAEFQRTNQYGLNVQDLIKKNFPNLVIKTAPEYATASSGELMQLILDDYEGVETCTAAFTEKLRAHAMVVGSSSFSQKKSQGTWGTIVFRPVFIASSLG